MKVFYDNQTNENKPKKTVNLLQKYGPDYRKFINSDFQNGAEGFSFKHEIYFLRRPGHGNKNILSEICSAFKCL